MAKSDTRATTRTLNEDGTTTVEHREVNAPEPPPDELDGMPAGGVDPLQLPLFDGWRVYALELALTGSVELQLTQDRNREIHDAANLREHVVVTLQIGELDPIVLDASVTAKTVKLKSEAGGMKRTVQTVRITVDED